MSIPWYYIWSHDYRIFHEIMQDSIKYPEFELSPIEIPQERFDSELYKNEGQHFWYKSLIKVDTILDCLKKGHEQSKPYILFTDIDIVVRENIYKDVKGFMDKSVDMVFMKEGSIMNIGFMLLRVCDEVYSFWQLIRSKMMEKDGLDQMYVNECLLSYRRMYTHFDEKLYTSSNLWNGSLSCKVIQVLCDGLIKEYNIIEKIVCISQLINIKPYIKYVDAKSMQKIEKFVKEVLQAEPGLMFNPVFKDY
jgi:hypothetical protein